jgi:hypothetical protein
VGVREKKKRKELPKGVISLKAHRKLATTKKFIVYK